MPCVVPVHLDELDAVSSVRIYIPKDLRQPEARALGIKVLLAWTLTRCGPPPFNPQALSAHPLRFPPPSSHPPPPSPLSSTPQAPLPSLPLQPLCSSLRIGQDQCQLASTSRS